MNTITQQPPQLRIAYFITDHGLGHASRSILVIRQLLKQCACAIQIVTAAPLWFFESRLPKEILDQVVFVPCKTDVGAYTLANSFATDVQETKKQLDQFWQHMDEKIEKLVPQLQHVDVIVYDICALAPLVAKRLQKPSIGYSNFDWVFIYSDPYFSNFDTIVQAHRDAYAQTSLFLHLPYGIPQECLSYPTIKNINAWISETEKKPNPTAARNFLSSLAPDLPENTKLMLFSFGGHAFPYAELIKSAPGWNVPPNWRVCLPSKLQSIKNTPSTPHYEGVIQFVEEEMIKHASYADLLASVDCIVCKTGYGLVSECMALVDPAKQVILYVDRDGFREHEKLEMAFQDRFKCDKVSVQDVIHATSNLFHSANKLLAQEKECAPVCLQGAELVAKEIVAFCAK